MRPIKSTWLQIFKKISYLSCFSFNLLKLYVTKRSSSSSEIRVYLFFFFFSLQHDQSHADETVRNSVSLSLSLVNFQRLLFYHVCGLSHWAFGPSCSWVPWQQLASSWLNFPHDPVFSWPFSLFQHHHNLLSLILKSTWKTSMKLVVDETLLNARGW